MSLTRLISIPQVRAELAKLIRKPAVEKPAVRVPRQAPNPQRLGMAFDYALRFGLIGRGWGEDAGLVAENALILLHKADRDAAVERIERARAVWRTEGTPSRAAARACFDLAALEVVYRARDTSMLSAETTDSEIDELLALYAIVPWDLFRPRTRLWLNPNFGEGSHLVGGADADMVVDSTLIDIKVTRDCTVEAEAVRQVVAYALLARRYGLDGGPPVAVDRIGLYFARAGALVAFSLDECLGTGSHDEVLELLISNAD